MNNSYGEPVVIICNFELIWKIPDTTDPPNAPLTEVKPEVGNSTCLRQRFKQRNIFMKSTRDNLTDKPSTRLGKIPEKGTQ